MVKLNRAVATALEIREFGENTLEIETEFGPALLFVDLAGEVSKGDRLIVNRTARLLNLGTGGYDFVIAVCKPDQDPAPQLPGHIIKARYTPSQSAVYTLEEQTEHADIWTKNLRGFPVIVCELHSQIAPAAASLSFAGAKVCYIATDGAALPVRFSKLAARLKELGAVHSTISAGQAFGGDYETVTVHSAALAAKHILGCDCAIIAQGPGNAGTGTKYGFSGIEQAENLNAAGSLGAVPIVVVRMSSADKRRRHQGISHHTQTALELALVPCIVPVPSGIPFDPLPPRHRLEEIDRTKETIEKAKEKGIPMKSMGRGPDEDPIFFEAAAAAGLYALKCLALQTENR